MSKQSALGQTIDYSLNQWAKLRRYVEDSRLSIDNNRAERAVKPFVIGRKNWLFNHNHRGAEASAMLYSMIETAKANGTVNAITDKLQRHDVIKSGHLSNYEGLFTYSILKKPYSTTVSSVLQKVPNYQR